MTALTLRQLPLWARVAIERLDACSDLRTQRQFDELLDAYAKTYGKTVDKRTRADAIALCRQRFGDSFKPLPVPADVPPGTLRLVRLAREGALSCGDLVATQRLGDCEVVRIHSTHTIEVRTTSSGNHHLISGLFFGPDARIASTARAAGPSA